jgi:hypothetical protein
VSDWMLGVSDWIFGVAAIVFLFGFGVLTFHRIRELDKLDRKEPK